jgi:hypothetical protein
MTRQYYHRNNKCQADDNEQFNCSCWHDIGTGPFPELTEDVCETDFFPDLWRDKPEPPWTAAVWPEDVLPEDSLVGRMLEVKPTSNSDQIRSSEPPPPATVRPWRVTTQVGARRTTLDVEAATAATAILSALELGGAGYELVACLRDGEWWGGC